MIPKDLKELLRAFNEQKVKYLVVGGYAFGVYAEPRATKELDLFIQADEENSKAVFRALAEYGAPLAGFSSSDFRDGLIDAGTPTLVISKEDLIKNKLASGRERDLLDAKELQAAGASAPEKGRKNK